MGNSCTREAEIVLSETGTRPTQANRSTEIGRGRWSAIGYEGSVDLDALLEAPSPAMMGRRRKRCVARQGMRDSARHNRRSGSSRSTCWWHILRRGKSKSERIRATVGRASSGSNIGDRNSDRSKKKNARGRGSGWFRSSKSSSAINELVVDEEEESTYHSYEDPGYVSSEMEAALDSDLILASPPESPTVIHARWGEPVDDPDEESVCTDFKPNPFKLGFCINCQKQHDVNENGDVVSKKEYKKIARPTISKTAANALDNPAAVENITPRGSETDVDLAALLKQRRDIIVKLGKLQQDTQTVRDGDPEDMKHPDYASARHTMFLADANGTNLANLRRMASAGRTPTSQQPQSLRVQRAASVRTDRAPASYCGVPKSKSLSSVMPTDEEEPAPNDWL